jgi:hypothetical protein
MPKSLSLSEITLIRRGAKLEAVDVTLDFQIQDRSKRFLTVDPEGFGHAAESYRKIGFGTPRWSDAARGERIPESGVSKNFTLKFIITP